MQTPKPTTTRIEEEISSHFTTKIISFSNLKGKFFSISIPYLFSLFQSWNVTWMMDLLFSFCFFIPISPIWIIIYDPLMRVFILRFKFQFQFNIFAFQHWMKWMCLCCELIQNSWKWVYLSRSCSADCLRRRRCVYLWWVSMPLVRQPFSISSSLEKLSPPFPPLVSFFFLFI